MYNRNKIHISEKEQQRMRDFKIVFGGLGLGSNIAECALRAGFETLHLVDGDVVELSNLNRQNYTHNDIGKPKCVALYERLKQINSNANITYSNVYLTPENLAEHLAGADVAVNAIDSTSDMPMVFDDVCFEMNIPVVRPLNLGFSGFACVLTKQSSNLKSMGKTSKEVELNLVEHTIKEQEARGSDMSVLKRALAEYIAEGASESPPQLSIASAYVGGLCTGIFLKILREEPILVFPEFYYAEPKVLAH